jgi:hypothetical protein
MANHIDDIGRYHLVEQLGLGECLRLMKFMIRIWIN